MISSSKLHFGSYHPTSDLARKAEISKVRARYEELIMKEESP
jgi:hypothetical protein